ncbi:hypothetical protein ACIQLJ_13925 [Microbacterium sp. NPDC091313]
MLISLAAVGLVVAAGLAVAAWFAFAPGPSPSGQTAGAAASAPAASSGADPLATPTTGSEVLPPAETARPRDGVPAPPAASPRVSLPLPAAGSDDGGVIDGFPTDLASPTDGSDVLSTSLATEGDVLQFSLRARTDADGGDVASHYTALWSSLGLAPAPASDDGSVSYQDGYSSVTIATQASGTGLIYTIYGVLRAG